MTAATRPVVARDGDATDTASGPPTKTGRAAPWIMVAVTAAVLAVPLLIALGVLHQPRWYPLGDIAQTELRVRDVASAHPPLIGLPGRIGTYPNQGSHPGPLSFYALWPYYQLLGASSFALLFASAALQFTAMVVALWIAWRRGGARMVLVIGVLLIVLAHNFGIQIIVEPWNPYLPVVPWVVFVLAVWSVCCADFAMLPIVAFAGSFCMQTHVSYVAPVGGLGLVALAAAARYLWSWRGDEHANERRRAVRFTVIAVVVGVLAWVPPVIQQFTAKHQGNLAQLWDYFRNPPTPAIGFHQGLTLLLTHLSPWSLIEGRHGVTGSTVPGAILLLVWAGSAALVWFRVARAAPVALSRLHVVLAAALVFELIAMSRIFGDVFFYLMLWSLCITGLMLIATLWTAGVMVEPLLGSARARRSLRWVTAATAAIGLVFTGWFSFDAAYAQMPLSRFGNTLGGLLPSTVAALHAADAARASSGASSGDRYLVTWFDPVDLGGRGYALLNELERAGFNVGAPAVEHAGVTEHRVLDPKDAVAQVHLAVGVDIQRWQAKPGVRQIAYYDPRSPAQRAKFNELHTAIANELHARHLDALMTNVDNNLYAASADPRMPPDARARVLQLVNLDLPQAVFLAPPSA
jgi:hypothetical protein